MANRKISELPAAGVLSGAELVEAVQGGVNVQTTVQAIADLGGGGDTPGPLSRSENVTTLTVDDDDHNYIIVLTHTDAADITLPNTVAIGTYVTFIRGEGAGLTTFVPGGTSVFYTLGDETTIEEERAWVSWLKVSATEWYGAGGLGPVGTGGGGSFATLTGDPSDNAALAAALAAKVSLAGSKVIQLAASDETSSLTTGTGKIKFRMPYAMTVSAVRASLSTAQTSGSILTIDINDSGTTILSTKLTIDNGEKTSTTAAAAAVISDTELADDAEISIDIDQVGDGTAKGLKITLIGS